MEKDTNKYSEVDSSLDKSLLRVANLEASTDILVQGDQLTMAAKNSAGLPAEFALDEGVTDNAPYKNIAEYAMVQYHFESEDEQHILQNYQSS